jgi:hypothetical protein
VTAPCAPARVVAGTDTTLLPAGWNAQPLRPARRITNLDELAAAREANVVQRLDVGYVNDEIFLNNANVGWYVELVRRRERYEERLLPLRQDRADIPADVPHPSHRPRCRRRRGGGLDGVDRQRSFPTEPTRLAERRSCETGY